MLSLVLYLVLHSQCRVEHVVIQTENLRPWSSVCGHLGRIKYENPNVFTLL